MSERKDDQRRVVDLKDYKSRVSIPFLRQSTQNLLPGFCKSAFKIRVCLSFMALSALRAPRVDMMCRRRMSRGV